MTPRSRREFPSCRARTRERTMTVRRMIVLIIFLLFWTPPAAYPLEGAPKKPTSLCGIRYPSDDGLEWECRKVKRGDTPLGLFGKYWKDGLRFNRIDRRHFIAGQSIKVPRRLEEIEGFTPMPGVYPDAAGEAKFILVDQSESFLGAYEYGRLVFSAPVALGEAGHRTPNGEYRISAIDRRHKSSLYRIEGTDIPYPMYHGLRFHISRNWISYWLHSRDLPGYPASHGCIGLYDESMQKKYYGNPREPILNDARVLYLWVVGDRRDTGRLTGIADGPRLLIIGEPPL